LPQTFLLLVRAAFAQAREMYGASAAARARGKLPPWPVAREGAQDSTSAPSLVEEKLQGDQKARRLPWVAVADDRS
jgi:hypothetical protein